MKWLADSPKQSGFYWYRIPSNMINLTEADQYFGDAEVVKVEVGVSSSEVFITGFEPPVALAEMNGEWAGPLLPPE